MIEKIKINVAYYDKKEQLLFQNYPTYEKIAEAVKNGLSIDFAQILVYYLYNRRRPRVQGISTYHDIANSIGIAEKYLRDFVSFDKGTINFKRNVGPIPRDIIEYLGEAISLSVASWIHNLNEADWDKIPEHPGRNGFPTFDYENNVFLSSDTKNTIQIEAKGSAVDNNRVINSAISNHKGKIKSKKRRIESQNGYIYPASIRYGMIGAIDECNTARCLIIDPEPDVNRTPIEVKTLNRIQFMYNWISFLANKSNLATSLSNRIKTLINIENIYELDGIPLIDGKGDEFDIYSRYYGSMDLKYRKRLSHISDGPGIGRVIQNAEGRLIFIGIQGDLFQLVIDQNFGKINSYMYDSGSVYKKINCVLTKSDVRKMKIDREMKEENGHLVFEAEGMLYYGNGGSIFGTVQ